MKRIIIFSAAVVLLYIVGVIINNLPTKNTSLQSDSSITSPTSSPVRSDNLKIEDTTVGTGAEAKTGQMVTVNYIGKLSDGTTFDSSYERKEPYTFTLGAAEVIKGWDEGIVGMKVGGKRKLTIPAELGYGTAGQGSIPANATLIFDIELLEVKGTATPQTIQPNLNL